MLPCLPTVATTILVLGDRGGFLLERRYAGEISIIRYLRTEWTEWTELEGRNV